MNSRFNGRLPQPGGRLFKAVKVAMELHDGSYTTYRPGKAQLWELEEKHRKRVNTGTRIIYRYCDSWFQDILSNFNFLDKTSFGYSEMSDERLVKCQAQAERLQRDYGALILVVGMQELRKQALFSCMPDLYFSDLILETVETVIRFAMEFFLGKFCDIAEGEWAKKLNFKNKIYNFSSHPVNSGLVPLIERGLNYKPLGTEERSEVTAMKIMNQYRTKIMHRSALPVYSMESYLKTIKKEKLGSAHWKYFFRFYKGTNQLKQMEKRNKKGIQQMVREDQIILECDKSWGFCVLNRDDFYKSEQKVIASLEGKELEQDIDEVYRSLEEQEAKLEAKYWGTEVGSLLGKKGGEGIRFPEIKITPKIHKLSDEQKKSRHVEDLKFRPIIRAVKPPTRSANETLFKLALELKEEVLQRFEFGKFFPKSSLEFCENLRKFKVKSAKYRLLASIDIGSAYDNTTKENCLEAVAYLGLLVGFDQEKLDLMKDLIIFIMENNIIQYNKKCVKLADVVPQGGVSSGTLLDLVVLCGELNILHEEPVGNHLLPSFVDSSLKTPEAVVDNYQRFLDDTFVTISADSLEDLQAQIGLMRKIFPTHMEVNFDIHPFVMQFLEVFVFLDIADNKLDFTVKKDFQRPMKCKEYVDSNNTPVEISGMFVNERKKIDTCCSRPLLKNSMTKILKMTASKFKIYHEVQREDNKLTRTLEEYRRNKRKKTAKKYSNWVSRAVLPDEIRSGKISILKPRVKFSKRCAPVLKWRHEHAMNSSCGFYREFHFESAKTIKTLICQPSEKLNDNCD